MILVWIFMALTFLWRVLQVAPGTRVIVSTTSTPRSSPTDSGTAFFAGLTDSGPANRAVLITSLTQMNTIMGVRVSYSSLWDSVDNFFREGGNQVWIGRVVGPGAVIAFRNLVDNVAAVSLIVKAKGPGASGNAIKVAVIAAVSAGYRVQVYDTNNVVLETSPDLATQQDAVTWSQGSQYVDITVGASALVPVVAGANVIGALATGTDDRTNIVDANWLTALNLFTKDLGPGQVAVPGRTTDVGHQQIADHAKNNNRVALMDAPDVNGVTSTSTLTTSATNSRTTGSGQYAGLFWPWVLVPGVVVGTSRTVPPSSSVAGAIARNDALNGPNNAAAGVRGELRYAIGLSQPSVDETTRDTLNTSGVNVIRNINGAFRIYGWRTQADPVSNPYWLQLGVPRIIMTIAALALEIGEGFVFETLDGQGRTIMAYNGALVAMLQPFYETGQIYGATAADAFNVDTSPTVNTQARIQAGELRAVIAIRPSPDAELVTIEIVNVPITQEVS